MPGLRLALYLHLAAYLSVNLLLILINLGTTPGYLWFQWPLCGWGIGLLAHAVVTSAIRLGRTVNDG
jgi:hypothetical protein